MKLIEKQKEYMVLYHNNKYKDVSNRERKRVYGIISQQIADIIPEAVSTQKGTLYDIYSNFKSNGNIIHINIFNPIKVEFIEFTCHDIKYFS